jgi:methylated-DNA-[protein]-cysteine S-methyltransferase
MTIEYTTIPSPIGELVAVSNGRELTGLYTPGHHARPMAHGASRRSALFDELERQLALYFARKLTAFDVPLALDGTAFQRRVWSALRRIPHGATVTYGELAREIANASAARAVGAANAKNPISIVVPCHRVIASDGDLRGYAGGISRKQWLVQHERAPTQRSYHQRNPFFIPSPRSCP